MATSTAELDTRFRQIMEDIAADHPYLFPREARWRYFGSLNGRGWAFAWTTEKVRGKYQSFAWKPAKGGWERVRTVEHATRKAAKARALRMAAQRHPERYAKAGAR
jgi:hypothetical protein